MCTELDLSHDLGSFADHVLAGDVLDHSEAVRNTYATATLSWANQRRGRGQHVGLGIGCCGRHRARRVQQLTEEPPAPSPHPFLPARMHYDGGRRCHDHTVTVTVTVTTTAAAATSSSNAHANVTVRAATTSSRSTCRCGVWTRRSR